MSKTVKTAALAPVWDEELDSLPSDVDRVPSLDKGEG